MIYNTGDTLHSNTKSGNIWIVTGGPYRTVSLLWDGLAKRFAPDEFFKRDTIKVGRVLKHATLLELATLGALPIWAKDLIAARANLAQAAKASVASTILPPAAVAKVQQALGINLTPEVKPARIVKSTLCPARKDGDHVFKSYTGLNQSFDYCVHCDEKSYPIKT